jgi:hypothetical protein
MINLQTILTVAQIVLKQACWYYCLLIPLDRQHTKLRYVAIACGDKKMQQKTSMIHIPCMLFFLLETLWGFRVREHSLEEHRKSDTLNETNLRPLKGSWKNSHESVGPRVSRVPISHTDNENTYIAMHQTSSRKQYYTDAYNPRPIIKHAKSYSE